MDGSPANKKTDICKHEAIYFIDRYQTCARLGLQYLLDQNFDDEAEMEAVFDYMLSTPIQLFLNFNDTASCTEIRTKIQKQIEFYKINPPTNNKFASDIYEMENMLKAERGYANSVPRTMSYKSKNILYPYTNQSPTDDIYTQYAYDNENRKCFDAIQDLTRYYHIMFAGNYWLSMFKKNEEDE